MKTPQDSSKFGFIITTSDHNNIKSITTQANSIIISFFAQGISASNDNFQH